MPENTKALRRFADRGLNSWRNSPALVDFRAQYLGLVGVTSSPYNVITLLECVPTSMSPKQ